MSKNVKQKMHTTMKIKGVKKMHGGETVIIDSCLRFQFFYPIHNSRRVSGHEIKKKKSWVTLLGRKKMWESGKNSMV